jgi:hypothetical protein
MPVTKIIGNQESTAINAGTATSISSATCVRLYNDSGSPRIIGINTVVGAATTSFFSMPNNTVEFLSKLPTDVIWTDGAAIKANKVAFTN